MTTITMPALSPTMEEGNLARWLVKPGDRIEPGQIIAEIETDKATMEVEAVDEGVIAELLVSEGAQGVKINTPLAVLRADAGAKIDAPPAAEASAPLGDAQSVARKRSAPRSEADAGEIVTGSEAPATALARRLAVVNGIDLTALAGSGPGGRIVRRDVEAAVNAPRARHALRKDEPLRFESRALARPAPAPVLHKTLEQQGIRPGSYDLAPLDMMRKTIAKRMADSFRDVPHFPLTIDIEIDALLAARSEINRRFADDMKISVNDMCIKAAALALKLVPEANASYSSEGIALHHHADIAVAVALDWGLITPIIWAAETKGLAQISHEMADLAERARNKRLKPEEYQGGSFSISNMGMMGIKGFASIINEPHGAIMSIGAGEKRPVVKNDVLSIATVMSVTLTCDHRVVDGALGAALLHAFKGFLEDPVTMAL